MKKNTGTNCSCSRDRSCHLKYNTALLCCIPLPMRDQNPWRGVCVCVLVFVFVAIEAKRAIYLPEKAKQPINLGAVFLCGNFAASIPAVRFCIKIILAWLKAAKPQMQHASFFPLQLCHFQSYKIFTWQQWVACWLLWWLASLGERKEGAWEEEKRRRRG